MKKFACILLLTKCSFLSFAQEEKQKAELGIFLGGSYYLGDMNPSKPFAFTKPAGGLVYRKIINPRYALKSNLLAGSLYATDSKSNDPLQKNRNLHFKSLLIELAGEIEFNFLPYEIGNPRYPFSPYAFIGLAGFYFNPKAELGGSWHNLQPLGTEGQGNKKYFLTQISIPFGLGFKVSLSKRIGLSCEWGLRKTFTDYIDDVSTTYPDPVALQNKAGTLAGQLSDPSLNKDNTTHTGYQRGNSKNKDWYSFAGITIGYRINAKEAKCPAYNY